MPTYGKKAPIKRLTAGAAHRRHQIVTVLRSDGADFYPLAVAQCLDDRIVRWLDQDRTSLMNSKPPEDPLNDRTSTSVLNEAQPGHLKSSFGAASLTEL